MTAQRLIGLLAGRWTLSILADLAGGEKRYQELDDSLDGISHKVLTDTLRRAERDGLVTRHLDPGRVDTATLYRLNRPRSMSRRASRRSRTLGRHQLVPSQSMLQHDDTGIGAATSAASGNVRLVGPPPVRRGRSR